MATNLNTLKNWFKTGLKPTQAQFWAMFDSFWHKDSSIPTSTISGLDSQLNLKQDKIPGLGLTENNLSDELLEKILLNSKKEERKVYVQNFGAKGDGIQLNDFSIVGNTVTSPSANFTSDDVGKIISLGLAGAEDEHLVTKILSITNSTTAILEDDAINNVSNVMGSYGTDNFKPLQDAWDFAIHNQLPLYAPVGIYLIGDLNIDTGHNEVRASTAQFTFTDMNFTFYGDGAGLTVFRDLDGKTQRIGRYTRTFFAWLQDSFGNLGKITVKDMTIDKNARSLYKAPPSDFEWEQSYAFQIGGASDKKIEGIRFENVEIFDKIGGGLVFSSGDSVSKKNEFINISEKTYSVSTRDNNQNIKGQWNADTNTPDVTTDLSQFVKGDRYDVTTAGAQNGITYTVGDQIYFNGVSWLQLKIGRMTNMNGIIYGERGEIESAMYCPQTQIDSSRIRFAQIESESAHISTKEKPRTSFITNSVINNIEYTEHPDVDQRYTSLYLYNVVTPHRFLVRNVRCLVSNSEIRITETPYSQKNEYIHSTIKLKHNIYSNTVDTVIITPLSTNINNSLFKNCDFIIDSEDDGILPTGYAMGGSPSTNDKNNVVLDACTFDTRFRSMVDAYRSGSWTIKNCKLSGTYRIFNIGGFSIYENNVYLENNDYNNVNSGTEIVRINNNNLLWKLSVDERINMSDWILDKTGSVGSLESQILSHPTLLIDDIANRTGKRYKGEIVEITNPVAGGYYNYLCVTAGTDLSSLFKGFNLIES